MSKLVQDQGDGAGQRGRPPHDDLRSAGRARLPAGGRGGRRLRARPRRSRRSTPTRAASTRRCTAASSGRCGSSRASAAPAQTNERFKYLLEHGGRRALGGLRPADADGPRLRPPAVARRGRQVRRRDLVAGRHGDALRRHPARRGHDLDDDQLAGRDAARRSTSWCGGEAGRAAGGALGHAPERHPEGVHRPEGVHLPAAAEHADHRRHDRATAPSTCRSGTRSRSRGYHIREAGSTAAQELAFTLRDGIEYVRVVRRRRAGRRRLRAAARRSSSTRTTTSSRRSPSTARRAGSGRARCASASRRKNPRSLAAALPHPDRRRVAHGAAALQQRRAHGAAGARRRARRHAVAAHQLARRDARAADRGGGDDRAAHAADHRPRDRASRTRSIRSAAPTSSRS